MSSSFFQGCSRPMVQVTRDICDVILNRMAWKTLERVALSVGDLSFLWFFFLVVAWVVFFRNLFISFEFHFGWLVPYLIWLSMGSVHGLDLV